MSQNNTMKKVSTFLFVSSALLFDVTVSANDGWATFSPIEPSTPSTHMNQANQCANYTRNIDIASTPDNGCTHLIAQKQIRLLPGFRFNATDAQSDNTFSARIDQGLICPPTHGLTKMSDGTLSSGEGGFAVGSIPYEYSVSNTGAAVYSIPIECPKGINGMEPKISLVYNSQAGDGIMGWGWSIGGLSAITRVNKNQYFDEIIQKIDWEIEQLEEQRYFYGRYTINLKKQTIPLIGVKNVEISYQKKAMQGMIFQDMDMLLLKRKKN